MRIKILLIFVVISSCCPVQLLSQELNGFSYYPLCIGNQWNYSNEYFTETEKIVDTTVIKGILYYGLALWEEEADYWIREDSNRIYLLDNIDSTEFVLFDFNTDIGESWELPAGYGCSFGTKITLTGREDTITTTAGTFLNCYHFEHQPLCVDAGIHDTWFAEGIGKVRYTADNFAGMLHNDLVSYSIVTSFDQEKDEFMAGSFHLAQNYPNPFNSTTIVSYSIPEDGLVDLSVYNLLGEKIITLVNYSQSSGNHEVAFNAENFSSGIYLCKLVYGNGSKIIKMILLR